MKIAVVGSRTFNNRVFLMSILNEHVKSEDELISGGASGADALAYWFAEIYQIPITIYLPNFTIIKRNKETGYPPIEKVVWPHKGAGLMRNTTIVENSDLVIAFWDGESRGTLDTIQKCEKMNKKILVFKN